MSFNEKDHLAAVMVNTLLYSEKAQDELIKLLWERLSEEQKQVLIESRIYGIGQGVASHGRVNFFARHVEAAVKRSFEAEKVAEHIGEIVREQLTATKLGLRDTVTTIVNTMTGSLVKNIIERVDVYALQSALREALKGDGKV